MREALTDILVSVIVLTYNHKDFIRQALDSILMQVADFPYEILIGDDASSDGTSEIVREYAERYPHCIRAFIREKNLGATKNLYDLYLRARGKYIANCEGDDYWCDVNKLQIQTVYLEENPELIACTHDCWLVDEEGQPKAHQRLPWVSSKAVYTLDDFKGLYLSGHPSTLVHRNFFLDKAHDYSIIYKAHPYIADRTVNIILAAQGKIVHIPKKMSCYRQYSSACACNATTLLFEKNPQVNRMQYDYVCALEEYLKSEFGIRISFRRFKLEHLLKWRIKNLIQRSKK